MKVNNEINISKRRLKTVKYYTAEYSVKRLTKVNNNTEQTFLYSFKVISLIKRHISLIKMFLINTKSYKNSKYSLKTSFCDMFLRERS